MKVIVADKIGERGVQLLKEQTDWNTVLWRKRSIVISVTAIVANHTGHARRGVIIRTASVSPAGGKNDAEAPDGVRYQ